MNGMTGARTPNNTSAQTTQTWLRNELLDYAQRDIAFSHIDGVLAAYPLLRLKRELFIYDDGRAQHLLSLSGLIPITYRGASYNIPISLWIPFDYPTEPPMVYVVPTPAMVIKASKELDPSGRWSGEYVRAWGRKGEACSLRGLCEALREAFGREPPLYRKAKEERQATPPVPSPSRPAVPGTPDRPPPPPPPPPRPPSMQDGRIGSPAHGPAPPSDPRARPPPPLPNPYAQTAIPRQPAPSAVASPLPYQPPARPPLPEGPVPSYGPSPAPFSPHPQPLQPTPPLSPHAQGSPAPFPPHTHQTPVPYPPRHWAQQPANLQRWSSVRGQVGSPHDQPPPAPPSAPTPNRSSSNYPYQAQPPSVYPSLPTPQPKPYQPPPDFLSSDPDPPPALSSPLSPPPPPLPPTPQLFALHTSLASHLRPLVSAHLTAAAASMSHLHAIQQELLAGPARIEDEMARLAAVRDVCRGVVARLDGVVREAEGRVAEVKARGEVEVDEIVCADSIVGNQLIDLVAEDNAIEDTIYHLHRALNSGRIDLDRFIKTTRSLAEEQFMKRALMEKILNGLPMGLWSP